MTEKQTHFNSWMVICSLGYQHENCIEVHGNFHLLLTKVYIRKSCASPTPTGEKFWMASSLLCEVDHMHLGQLCRVYPCDTKAQKKNDGYKKQTK